MHEKGHQKVSCLKNNGELQQNVQVRHRGSRYPCESQSDEFYDSYVYIALQRVTGSYAALVRDDSGLFQLVRLERLNSRIIR